jgi:hypothetical protein
MGLAVGSPLKLFSVPKIIELHTKISGMIRKFSVGSSPLDVHNIDRCYEAAAAVADEFIHNNDNGSEGKKGGKGGKSDKHSVERKKADKADKGGESARIARMAADAGILAASMGIGCFLALDRHFMSETAFLISERAFGEAAGAAARAKLGSAASGRAGKPDGSGMKGARIKLAGLFSHPESFKSAEAFIYGANEAAHYHEKNLLRGKNPAVLKFVPAAGAGGRKAALASNNLQPGAKQMMELYGMRLKIEAALDSPENPPQGFSRRFWSESAPKMRGLDFKGVRAGLDEKAKSGIFKPLRAIEAFLAFRAPRLACFKWLPPNIHQIAKIIYAGMPGRQTAVNSQLQSPWPIF